MTDNSDWLTRLLVKEKARYYAVPSILRFLTYNKKLCLWASFLWVIALVVILLESLSTLGIIATCLSPFRVFTNTLESILGVVSLFVSNVHH
ncbi:MAG: hypothetical protein CNLJKLNK_00948 [Holosporales bacterium]